MTCVNCQKIIADTLSTLNGVKKVWSDLPRREITVEANFERVSDADIIGALAGQMYTAKRKNSQA